MSQVEHILDRLTEQGLRVTSARRAILDTLIALKKPASIAELARHTAVDTVTMYRNIRTLRAVGVIEEITTAGTTARFALAHDHHHDHLTCTRCGLIVHIPCTQKRTETIHHKQFSIITSHTITYYGLCTSCTR